MTAIAQTVALGGPEATGAVKLLLQAGADANGRDQVQCNSSYVYVLLLALL